MMLEVEGSTIQSARCHTGGRRYGSSNEVTLW